MMIKIWKFRRSQADQDQVEAQLLDEELEAVRKMEGEFRIVAEAVEADQEPEVDNEQSTNGGSGSKPQVSWQQTRQKVPMFL